MFTLENVGYLHNIEMSSLQTSSKYEYRVLSSDGEVYSDWLSFESPPYEREGGEVASVFADFGLVNDVSMDFIVADADIDYMIHVGDFAYDLNDNNSAVGNEFMQILSRKTQTTPYMVAVGNHELHGDDNDGSEYVQRFRGVASHAGERSGSGSNFYYSYNRGLVHYVVINTEIYRWIEAVEKSPLPHTAQEQLDWLEKDLAGVDRERTPWIVAMGHKAWYMSSWGDATWKINGDLPETNWTAFEPLFCEYGVELYLSGHVHLYQRFYPLHASDSMALWAAPKDIDTSSVSDDTHTITNPKWMTTLIVASPGDREVSPRVVCTGLTSEFNLNPLKYTQALCTAGYGFGHLHIVNKTHLYWEFFQTGKAPNVNELGPDDAVIFENKKLRDYMWLEVQNHGMRDYC